MQQKAKSLLNVLAFLLVISAITVIIQAGKSLEIGPVIRQFGLAGADQQFPEALHHPVPVFLMQLIVILVTSQICGFLFRKIGQPAVMGEIIAGILLGPSFIGAVFPDLTAFVFPPESLTHLHMLSQIGLVLFMFVIGMELDLNLIRSGARAAVFISNASIVMPYLLGVALSYFLYSYYAPPDILFYAFALFMGIAMSITAFPVLARVIREKGLGGTRLGTIAIGSAAAGDITGWCILALVVAVVKAGSVASSVYTILGATAFVLLMYLVVRKLLQTLISKTAERGSIPPATLAVVFLVMLLSAWCSEVLGIHALFGAFLAGAVMPDKGVFRKTIIGKIEDVALVLLLPLFFVFTGLRTEIGLLHKPGLWLACILIITVAILGKFGGSAIAARLKGESWRDSLAIGALMNTRGLMELIILNIGYDLGILSSEIFAMMVVMALVTTFMTSPALTWIDRAFKPKAPETNR